MFDYGFESNPRWVNDVIVLDFRFCVPKLSASVGSTVNTVPKFTVW